jgi:hypothetical protein
MLSKVIFIYMIFILRYSNLPFGIKWESFIDIFTFLLTHSPKSFCEGLVPPSAGYCVGRERPFPYTQDHPCPPPTGGLMEALLSRCGRTMFRLLMKHISLLSHSWI